MTPANADDDGSIPAQTTAAVLSASEPLPDGMPIVRGYDFSDSATDYNRLLESYATSGFQATHFGQAVDIINSMLSWRPSPEQIKDGASPGAKCTIFLGYTSNLVSSGIRETICFLTKHKLIDVIVTSAGGVEEDLIKCLGDTGVASFSLNGARLRERGLNRIGNLLIPNDNYCKFEDWINPILDEALQHQRDKGTVYSPSSLIALLGERINNEESICYWASKNDIPIFCPALTDGSLGDMLFFHSYKSPGLIVDLVQDIRNINRIAINAKATGMIILGGGVVKHHIANANLMRNGSDFAVYVNTGHEFDGSDAGASPEEAISWGKIKPDARKTKVCADATLVFPLLVAQTFAKRRKR